MATLTGDSGLSEEVAKLAVFVLSSVEEAKLLSALFKRMPFEVIIWRNILTHSSQRYV
jgi:hypothetical protein